MDFTYIIVGLVAFGALVGTGLYFYLRGVGPPPPPAASHAAADEPKFGEENAVSNGASELPNLALSDRIQVSIFKPSGESVGTFGINYLDQMPQDIADFARENPNIPNYSYLEANGETWTVISFAPLQIKVGRHFPPSTHELPPTGGSPKAVQTHTNPSRKFTIAVKTGQEPECQGALEISHSSSKILCTIEKSMSLLVGLVAAPILVVVYLYAQVKAGYLLVIPLYIAVYIIDKLFFRKIETTSVTFSATEVEAIQQNGIRVTLSIKDKEQGESHKFELTASTEKEAQEIVLLILGMK